MTSLSKIPAEEALSAADDPFSITAGASLETERLILRPARCSDAATIAELADDARIASNLGRIPHPYRLKDAEAWISRALAREEGFELVIESKIDHAVIGAVGVKRRDLHEPDLVLGFWIGVPYFGRGFGTEAAQGAVDLAFQHLALARLGATTRAVNWSSRRVLENCGFQWIGQGMETSRYMHATVPVDRFVLDRAVWKAIKSWGARARTPCAREVIA
ncbi:MAG: GNAT family N-acetyltransferase [Hyphomicrobiaceae bacterium]|nr:GNAT family N-acetyltransferase [Hyphomicrobiaceae bacterium]